MVGKASNTLAFREHSPLVPLLPFALGRDEGTQSKFQKSRSIEQSPLPKPQGDPPALPLLERFTVKTKASLSQNSFHIREGDCPTHMKKEANKNVRDDSLVFFHGSGFSGANRKKAHEGRGMNEAAQLSSQPAFNPFSRSSNLAT